MAIGNDVKKSGTLVAAQDVLELAKEGVGVVLVQITGTFSATVVFEINVDQGSSPTWVAINALNVNTGLSVSSATAAGIFRIDVSGARESRVRCSAYTSGTVVVTMNGSSASASGNIAVSSVGGIVDTELPAAVTMGDNMTPADSPFVGALSYGWDGANWDRTNTFPGSADARSASTITGLNSQSFTYAFNGTTWDRVRTAAAPIPTGTVAVAASGYTTVISSTLTRPGNTTAYTAGDEVTDTGGAIITLTSIARASGGTGIIQGICATFSDVWAVLPSFEVWLFDTTSTPQTDNAAFAPADSVVDTCFAVIPLNATYVGTTGASGNMVMDTGQINVPFLTVGSANLFLRLVIRNAGQAGANSSTIKFRARALCD